MGSTSDLPASLKSAKARTDLTWPEGHALQDDIHTQIQRITGRVRMTDLLWAAGLSAGACGIFALTSAATISQALLIWLVIAVGLVVRYASTRVDWSRPVSEFIKRELELFERLRAVLNGLPEPVILLSDDGQIELFNPAAERLLPSIQANMPLASILRAENFVAALEKAGLGSDAQMAEFRLPGGAGQICRAYVTPLERPEEGERERRRLLIFLSDLSAETRLNQMRTDFIANASHELRTPLTSMLGFIETLRGHAKDDPAAQEKFLGIMESQAERMLRLVQDLMSLSRIELNEHVAPDGTVDLVEVCEDVRANLAPVISTYDGALSLSTNGDIPPIRGDRDQLFQVIQNLADNALKYSGKHPAVTIEIGRGDPGPHWSDSIRAGDGAAQIAARSNGAVAGLVFVRVHDQGGGIERSHLPRLTERFYRADVEESRARGGTGLGLAIVKHIVQRHRGGLQVESKEGEGAAFTVFLPGAAE